MSGAEFTQKQAEATQKQAGADSESKGRSFEGKAFPYGDLLERNRPVSKKHPPMSRYDRAAQFSSFAALTGHGEAISKTADMVEEKVAFEVEREAPEEI